AVEIHPSPAGNPVFVHREQIGVGDRPRPMHFKLKKTLPINVLCSLEAVQYSKTDLAVSICFHVGKIQSLSDFLGHVVSPGCTRCGRDNGSRENGTEAETTNGDTKISHAVNSHGYHARSRSSGRSSRAQTMFGYQARRAKF